MTDKYVLATDDDFEIVTPPEEETNGLMAMSAMSMMSGDEYEVPGDDEFRGLPLQYIGDAEYVEVPHYINGELVTSYFNMFENTSVKGVKSTNKNVVNMRGTFKGLQSTTLDLSEFDTSSVTTMVEMFEDSKLEIIDLSGFDISNIQQLAYMFRGVKATVGYARTQEEADEFNSRFTTLIPEWLTFVVKPTEPEEPEEPTNPIISTEEIIEEKPIAYETEYIQDRTMMVGEEVVDREGIEGIIQETYEVTTYEDGMIESELILSETIKEPVNEIVRQGTIASIEEEAIETSIEYETEYIEDDTLMTTDEVIEQEGLAGTTREIYEVTTHSDGEVDRVLIDTAIIEPVAEIIRVGTITSIEEHFEDSPILFITTFKEDDSLPVGEQVIEQEGLYGTTRETYKVITYKDGTTKRVTISTEVILEPVNEIILIGTKVEQPIKGQSPEERINLSLQRQFRTLNEDSYHYLTDNRNPVDHQLVFKTGFGSSMSWNSQDLTITIDIFNTGSISRTFDLIEAVEGHFTNRIMKVDGEFMVKFPPEHPITKQRIMETPSNEIRHYQLEMEARVTYDAKPRQGFQYTPL